MPDRKVVAKLRKLEAMTVERGASPAEAATAASLARRLTGRASPRSDSIGTAQAARRGALAPGVHVRTVTCRVLRTAGC